MEPKMLFANRFSRNKHEERNVGVRAPYRNNLFEVGIKRFENKQKQQIMRFDVTAIRETDRKLPNMLL